MWFSSWRSDFNPFQLFETGSNQAERFLREFLPKMFQFQLELDLPLELQEPWTSSRLHFRLVSLTLKLKASSWKLKTWRTSSSNLRFLSSRLRKRNLTSPAQLHFSLLRKYKKNMITRRFKLRETVRRLNSQSNVKGKSLTKYQAVTRSSDLWVPESGTKFQT